jgi:hypothetical protein
LSVRYLRIVPIRAASLSGWFERCRARIDLLSSLREGDDDFDPLLPLASLSASHQTSRLSATQRLVKQPSSCRSASRPALTGSRSSLNIETPLK